MGARIALFLGRTIWTRDNGGWKHECVGAGSDWAPRAVERLADILSAATAENTVLVFEPEGMAHQMVETPRVSRLVFASLARIRNEHSVVASENLGWGVEAPEPAASGEFMTQLHSELTPGLIHLRDACESAGSRLTAAWSASTAVAASMSYRPSPKARFAVILTPGFCAIASFGGGKRSFRAWVGSMSERDWKAFSVPIGDFETRASPSMADGELRRASIFVIADGDPGLICPIWSDLRDSGRVEAIVEIDAFAAVVARIPASHPANLVEAFPRPLELDRYLGSTTAAGLIATATLAAFALGDMSQTRKENELGGEHIRVLRDRVDRLNRNQIEMAHLRNQAPDAPWSTVGGHKALIGLASSIPDPVTLTSLKMGRDGGFELEAIVVGSGFNQDETRQMLSRFGFNPNAGNGWAFDAVAGRLVVRGTYKETAP